MNIQEYFVDKGFSKREAQLFYDLASLSFPIDETTEASDSTEVHRFSETMQYPIVQMTDGHFLARHSKICHIFVPMRFEICFWYYKPMKQLMVFIRSQYRNWDKTLENILNEAE